MGWYYTQGSTLKSQMAECSADWENTRDDGTHVKAECLKKCFRGAITHSGVMWSVWRHTITKPNGTVEVDVWIKCDLMKRHNGYGWGYKPMDESSHPYYYNCPASYLKMTPVACQEWRDQVELYHKDRRERLAAKRTVTV